MHPDRRSSRPLCHLPAVTWRGWVWRRGCWVKVCEADSIGECSRLLGEEAKHRGITNNTHMILTRGGVPQGPPPARGGPTPC
jgi:hypothetical protein